MIATQVTEKNLPSRNRGVRSEYRKQQIIQATLDCIDRLGLSQTTLASIAATAGISQGNLVFHFQTKENLLNQALQAHSKEYENCWQQALVEAQNQPIAQLCAIIQAPFKAHICNHKKISVWYAFWGESRSRPKYKQVCGQQDQAFSQALLTICQQVEKISNSTLSAETAAVSIEAVIDGLWQSVLIGPSGFSRKRAVATMFELIKVVYPDQISNIGLLQTEDLI